MSEEGTVLEIEVRDGAAAAVRTTARIGPVPYTVADLDTEGAGPGSGPKAPPSVRLPIPPGGRVQGGKQPSPRTAREAT